MKKIDLLIRKRKHKPEIEETKNCIIYTRVSDKKQEEGFSLEIQLEATQNYAKKNELNVLAYFGGKYESAQTDERKEFNRMLSFIKKSKIKVTYILVYTIDRFSRTGANAIYIADQLRKEKISIIAVTQPTDTSTPTGVLQQNIQFIFSQYENDLRREKCVAGMREKLLKGGWMGKAPIGYDMVAKNREQVFSINKQGELIKQAFLWKSQGISSTEIAFRLKSRGLTLYRQTLLKIFSNPFYCGLISHKLIGNEIIEGKHPPLISRDLYNKVNGIQDSFKHAQHKTEFIDVPLKHFIKCSECGTPFTGYEVKKKRLHYYKCNKAGCKCNKSAKEMHRLFENLLNKYSIDKELLPALKACLIESFNTMNAENISNTQLTKNKLKEAENKITMLEEKFVFGEITKELYEKFLPKLKEEKRELEQRCSQVDFELSNLDDCIDFCLKIASKLSDLWEVEDYWVKIELQNLLFPQGIIYDRENNDYRTSNINSVFQLIYSFSSNLKLDKNEKASKNGGLSSSVARRGIEPLFPG